MNITHAEHERRIGMILAFGGLLWAGTYNALAKGLTPYLSPMTLLILTEALTAAFIIMTFGLVPLLRRLLKMDVKSFMISIGYGLLNSAVAPLLWFTGLSYTSAANASILSSSDILLLLVLSHYFLGEKMTKAQYYGLMMAVAGIVIINVGDGTAQSEGSRFGDVLILLGSTASACGSLVFKKYLTHVMPELAIAIRNVSAIVVMALIAAALKVPLIDEVASFPAQKVILLLSFTFFSRYLNLAFFYEALDRLPATTLSLIQSSAPISGVFFAHLLLGESIHSYQIAGCTLIIGSLLVEHVFPSYSPVSRIHSIARFFLLGFRKSPGHSEASIPLVPRNV